MEFTKIDKFLFHSLDLCSIDSFSITISGIQNVIGENDVIDFSKSFQDEVIEEIHKNLFTIQPATVQLYFNLLFKKIEDYKTNKDWKYYPHFKGDLEHLEWQFQELLNQYSENEELLEIVYNKGGFKKYIINENDKKRLVIVERLKSEIEEIRDKYFNENLQPLPTLKKQDQKIQVSNEKCEKFFSAILKLEINFIKEEKKYIVFTFNGADNLADFTNPLIVYLQNAKDEILNNLLAIEDNKAREDYLKRLWFKCLDTDKNLFSVSDMFSEGGELNGNLKKWDAGIEGFICENQRIIIKLPDYEFDDLNEENFLLECYENQCKRNFNLIEFVFSLCQNQNVNLHINNEDIEGFLKRQNENINPNQTTRQKLKWIGTPSQFGFIIELLIQGGYLEKPTSSFTKDANFYLQHFDINTTPKTLSVEISETSNHLSTENRKRIIIPHKDKLK